MSSIIAPAITIEIRTEQGVEMRAMDRAEALNHGRVLAGECRRTRREYKAAMLALGEFLLAVKAAREWGGFGAWLAECGIHRHTAKRAMKVARLMDQQMPDDQRVSDAEDDDAILAGGAVDRESFASNNAIGTSVPNYQGSVRVQNRSAFASNNAIGTSVPNYQGSVRDQTQTHNRESENCGPWDAGFGLSIDRANIMSVPVVHPCQENIGKNAGAVAPNVVPSVRVQRPAAQLLLDQVYEAQREAREAMAFVTGWLAGPDVNRDAASIAAMLREIRTFKERAEKVAAAKAGA